VQDGTPTPRMGLAAGPVFTSAHAGCQATIGLSTCVPVVVGLHGSDALLVAASPMSGTGEGSSST
jgi:hypothetical protein